MDDLNILTNYRNAMAEIEKWSGNELEDIVDVLPKLKELTKENEELKESNAALHGGLFTMAECQALMDTLDTGIKEREGELKEKIRLLTEEVAEMKMRYRGQEGRIKLLTEDLRVAREISAEHQKETDIEHQRYLEVQEKYSNRLWEVCQELEIENDDTSQNIIKKIQEREKTRADLRAGYTRLHKRRNWDASERKKLKTEIEGHRRRAEELIPLVKENEKLKKEWKILNTFCPLDKENDGQAIVEWIGSFFEIEDKQIELEKENKKIRTERVILEEKLDGVKEILQTETLATGIENRFYKILNDEEEVADDY